MEKENIKKPKAPTPAKKEELVPPEPQSSVKNKPEIKGPEKKSKWWMWACLGCSVLLIIILIIAALIGIKIFREVDKNLQVHQQEQEEIKYQEYQEAEEKLPAGTKYKISDTNKYKVTEKITLTNNGPGDASRIDLRMAMIKDIKPYQDVTNEKIKSSVGYDVVGDDYNNKYAHFDFPGLKVGEKILITAQYNVSVNAVKYNLSECGGELIEGYLDAEKYIESDNAKIKNRAKSLAKGDENKCETAEDIYDYVADNVTYEGYVPQDQGALNSFNKLSGDCTDFTDLFLGLSRASGIPARFLEGLGYVEDAKVPADVKHDWAEVYLPGIGWTQVDPTWGRYENARDLQFARTDGSHIIMTRGRNLDVLNNAHYFAYNYWWEGAESQVDFTEEWDVELVE